MFYRGESGANDSIVPTGDNFLEITAHMPNNELTKVLRDFRSYRPKNQKEYLAHLEGRASMAGVRNFAQQISRSKALYILLVDQIREFRNRHWNFTKSYIIKQSSYDIATGGSPILTYLPQNLSVVLKVLEESYAEWTAIDESAMEMEKGEHLISNADLVKAVQEAGKRASAQRSMLTREVQDLVKEKEQRVKTARNEAESRGLLYTSDARTPMPKSDDRMRVRGSVGCDGVG
jgi:indoleamine 2,3-dioxygenase